MLLRFSQSADIVKDDLGFLVLFGALRNANFDRVNHGEGGVSVINDFHGIIHTGNHNLRHLRAVVAVHGFRAAAPDKQSALDGHVVERNLAVSRAAANDEVTIHGQVFQLYIVGADQDATFNILVISTLGHNVSTNDVMENLRKFRARDVIQRRKDFAATMDIVCTDHRAHIRHRPVGNLASVGERRQIRFGIRIIVQFQRTGNDRHSLLTRDRRIRSHGRSRPTVVSTHLHGHCNVFVIPFGFCNVLVLADVCRLIAPE